MVRMNADRRPHGARVLTSKAQRGLAASHRGSGRDEAGDATPGSTHENLVQIMDEALMRQIGPDVDQHVQMRRAGRFAPGSGCGFATRQLAQHVLENPAMHVVVAFLRRIDTYPRLEVEH